ncbi:MAG: hypothetical protein QXY47_07610 [Thermoplasmata archaeon]
METSVVLKRDRKKVNSLNPLITPIMTQELADKVTNATIEFISKVSKISGVTKVAYKPKGNIITIWTFINKPDKDLQFSVYEIEQQIIEKYPELVFDFTIICQPPRPDGRGLY